MKPTYGRTSLWTIDVGTALKYVAAFEIFFQPIYVIYHGSIALDLSVMLYTQDYTGNHPVSYEKLAYNKWITNVLGTLAWGLLTLIDFICFIAGITLLIGIIKNNRKLIQNWKVFKKVTSILCILVSSILIVIDLTITIIVTVILTACVNGAFILTASQYLYLTRKHFWE